MYPVAFARGRSPSSKPFRPLLSVRQEYFHNATTNQTTWDRPSAPAAPAAAPPLPSKPPGTIRTTYCRPPNPPHPSFVIAFFWRSTRLPVEWKPFGEALFTTPPCKFSRVPPV